MRVSATHARKESDKKKQQAFAIRAPTYNPCNTKKLLILRRPNNYITQDETERTLEGQS